MPANTPQTTATTDRVVRVFISSTFRDMHAERDHLVTVVFPELRERVERLGLEFFDVDLRWGVPEKDANGETANSWEYCKKWIDRVQPFFVSLLGQRYGYVPPPQQIRDPADREALAGLSITEMEIRHAVLSGRIQRRSLFYLRQSRVPEDAGEAARKVFVEDDDKVERLKNQIRAGSRPVREYPCRWTGSGFAELERFGQMVLEDLWSGVLRDERYVGKEHWRQALGAEPDSDPRYTDETKPVPPGLAEKLIALAKPAPVSPLDAERQQMEAFAKSRLRWFQGRTRELQQLTGFLQSTAPDAPRLAAVTAVPGQGKSALLAKLWRGLSASEHSALRTPHSPFVIVHFVGVTERSSNAHALVQRLLDELDRSGIEWPADEKKEGEEPKRDFNSLCNRLANRLRDYVGERRIIILLDALNQLSDGHGLVWLPHRLGPQIRVVVSCVDDAGQRSEVGGQRSEDDSSEQRVLRALASRQPAPLRVSLGPLTGADVREIVVRYLEEYCHELDREHLDTLCAITQARNPLYLLVMLGELRTLGGDDMNRVVPRLIVELPVTHPNTVSLFRWVLQRLEVFGPEAVRWWCLYLAHGRVGMASHELADLLARKLGANAAPTALLVERGLRRYLQRRGAQLDFFHGQLRQAVMEQYGELTSRKDAETQSLATQVHRELADYFTACARGTDPQKEWETNNVRGFAECVFHLVKAGQHDRAASFLSNFPFLLHKLRVGLLEGVFEDYDKVRREAPAEIVNQLEIWSAFFRENAHILRRRNDEWPAHKILLQLAAEHAEDSPLTLGAESWLAAGRCNWLWLRRVPRLPHAQQSHCLAVLEGHTAPVHGALVLPNGRLLSWSDDSTLRLWNEHSGQCLAVLKGHTNRVWGALALPDGRVLSWDWALRLWDIDSGQCFAVLKGHSGLVRGALVLPDGRFLSWSDDSTLRLWDEHSGQCLAVLEGHTNSVKGALALPGGRILSWSAKISSATPTDNMLRIWDGKSGQCLTMLEGHTNWVWGALALPDGRILSWSLDKTLRLWDAHSGQCLAVLVGHTDYVRGATALSDGRIVSWSEDRTLRLWDVQSGQSLAVLELHPQLVMCVFALADGRVLSWPADVALLRSTDTTLRLWDADSGQCLAVLEGHSSLVKGGLILADGRILSWSGDDSLRLWDGDSGQCLAVLIGHTGYIWGATALSDGRIVSWSNDRTLRLWDAHNGQDRTMLEGHSQSVVGVLVLADGRILSWSLDKTLRLWDAHNGQCLAVLEGHSGSVWNALTLADGRILSWSEDKTLRLWDQHSGRCLAVLKGHSDWALGALALPDGRILSWAHDETLRLWDAHNGQCLAVLEGHSGSVWNALTLADGRILSWSEDKTLRLWDLHSGRCLAVLRGHLEWVDGVWVLANGKILSWSHDTTPRLWDGHSGQCVAKFEGHTGSVNGAMALAGGRVVSWSCDKTLRLWDAHSGQCLAALAGHTGSVEGAVALADGRILSWCEHKTLRLWDAHSGDCLEIVSRSQAEQLHPEWLHARAAWLHAWQKSPHSECVCGDYFVETAERSANFRHKRVPFIVAAWNAHTDTRSPVVASDGTAVVTQDNGQVCILKLHHGQRRVRLAEAETILAKRGELSVVSDQPSVP